MELRALKIKTMELFKKYRYMLLLVVIGIALLLLPSQKNTQTTEAQPKQQQSAKAQPTINEQLAQILSKIDGAGEVHVLLSLAAGEETIYQTDTDSSEESDSNHTKVDTVVITDGERAQTGLVRQINPPEYMGAVVVCQGADSPAVRLAVVSAVSKLTGLGADCISVLKMK